MLWQKEFTTTLRSMGFESVPHEPCCLLKDGIIIFFYVDDLIIAYHQDQQGAAQDIITQISTKFSLTGGKDLQWFLGIEVIRDRENRKIWLSQASYIDKISRLIDNRNLRHDTPMGTFELLPYAGLASNAEINRYQRKIGSILYAGVQTRPDIAFASSRLSRFLSNPGAEHQDAADRVLLYLLKFRSLGLQLGGADTFEVASDASFADNTLDRKSSQGYIIKLFGGLIAWRANKQETVTTSTTEAELLALSQVAKEALFTSRLLKELKITPSNHNITINCDNQQTIRLVTREIAKLQTKLRHVDIHNHWLRQEVSRGSITVEYQKSEDMAADGLTKALPAVKWNRFLDKLGLIWISEKITDTEVDLLDLEQRMEAFDID